MLPELALSDSQILGPSFPEIPTNLTSIQKIIFEEHRKFCNITELAATTLRKMLRGRKELDSKDAFKLFSSFGVPKQVLRKMLADMGVTFDLAKN